MQASLIFDLAPMGSQVSWSDNTPRPPERHRKKLAAWKTNNGQGRLVRKEAGYTCGTYTAPPAFTLHEGDFGGNNTIVMRVFRSFGIDCDLTFRVLARPPLGSVRVFDRPGPSAELIHLAESREAAELWLRSHRHPHAFLEDVPDTEAGRPRAEAA